MTDRTESLADFVALLDEAHAERKARETAYRARLDHALPAIAAELTESLLPADLRAAGLRLEWTAQP